MAQSVKPVIRENSTTTNGALSALSTSYATYSNTWTVKPSNGLAFTITDITNLQIGLQHESTAGSALSLRSTQVYVVVDYTPPASGRSQGHINGA